MRISDWSSDVCSSDLSPADRRARGAGMSVAGKTILYTGAAGGLGLRSTLALLAKGARVVAIDHDPAKIAALTEAAGGDERLHLVAADMSDLDAFRAALTEASAATGGFDVVINNAAIYPSKP